LLQRNNNTQRALDTVLIYLSLRVLLQIIIILFT